MESLESRESDLQRLECLSEKVAKRQWFGQAYLYDDVQVDSFSQRNLCPIQQIECIDFFCITFVKVCWLHSDFLLRKNWW